jgi:eukaryotic-like serine/threonine-protein kinase
VASALQVSAAVTRKRQTNRTIPDHASRHIEDAGIDGYGVVAEIARGGTSTVYLGEHLTTGERVAIKALHPAYVDRSDMVQRLLAEHHLAERVRHPGLLEVHHAAESAHGIPYVVMEYLDGESLGALVDRTALPIGSIVAIAAQVASAVAALHAAGVVHCDLKPDNVFVLYEMGPGGWPRIKVIDYGVARLADEPPLEDGSVVGTPVFMAPEQWAGTPTAVSDVYALGCVLFELITGEPLFSGALPQLMAAHCGRAPTAPRAHRPDLDPALDALILRMLSKRAAERPTMAEVEAALAELATLAFGPRPAAAGVVAMHAQHTSFTTRDRGGDAAGFLGSEIAAPGLDAAS